MVWNGTEQSGMKHDCNILVLQENPKIFTENYKVILTGTNGNGTIFDFA